MTVTAAGFDLDAKYRVTEGGILITGVQALARVLFDQIRADRRRGLRTAAFVCGYPGSPLGGFDQTLQRTGPLLGEHDVHWEPGVNEDLAATAVWGSQQDNLAPLSQATTASSACGTARRRAWTAAATCSGTPTCTAPAGTAACSARSATTRRPSPPRCPAPARSRCTTRACRCSPPAPPRRCSTLAGTATSCPGSAAAGSA